MKSLIVFEIEGLNQDRLFNDFIKNDIEIIDINKKEFNILSFKSEVQNTPKIKKIIKKHNIKLLKCDNLGLLKFVNLCMLRLGLFVGAVILLILFFIMNNLILNIKIEGNSFIQTIEIINFLKERNITTYTNKNTIDTQDIEFELIENFDKISLVSVAKKGATLVINIKEKSQNNTIFDENCEDWVSDYNGRILDITLINGTANVKKNQLIKKGDVLVFANTVDANGNLQKIKADAKITMEVWYESKYVFFENQIKTQRTGKVFCVNTVNLWGLKIFQGKDKVPFQKYEEDVTIKQLNSILPLSISTKTYYETATIEIKKSFEEEKEAIIQKCKENTLQNVQSSDIIESEKYSISQTSDCYILTYITTVRKEISKQVWILKGEKWKFISQIIKMHISNIK